MPTEPVSPKPVTSPWVAGGGGELAGCQARLGPGGALLGVDLQALHVGKVEHDAAVGGAVAGRAVAAAAHRQLERRSRAQRDHLGDVGGVGGADDDRRPEPSMPP